MYNNSFPSLDHCKSMSNVMNNGIDCYSSRGTFTDLGQARHHRMKFLEVGKQTIIGGFTILPFSIEHDTSEPLGFLIKHKELGKILFVTDTFYVKYTFKNVDHILIECNYTEKVLNFVEQQERRVLETHMSLETVLLTLKAWGTENTKTITLIHLSKDRGDKEEFLKAVKDATGKRVYVAEPGLEVN